MYSKTEWLTPEKAQQYLNNMVFNRPPIKAKISAYAESIRKGMWALTHQGIAFSRAGKLIDGQNRCHAVILANQPIEVLFHYDCDESTFQYLDQGAVRTSAQILHTLGYDGTKRLAAIARQAVLFSQGKMATNDPVLPAEITAFVDANKDAIDYSNRVTANTRYYPALIGALHFIFSTLPLANAVTLADDFVEHLRDGLNLTSKNNPIWRLKDKLERRPVGTSYATRDVLAWGFKAFNAHFNGDELKSLPRASESQEKYTVKVRALAQPKG